MVVRATSNTTGLAVRDIGDAEDHTPQHDGNGKIIDASGFGAQSAK